jgi:uncharacterized protein (UPF0261 family)
MKQRIAPVAVVGTFDSKSEEHLFLKKIIEKRGIEVLTINVGTKGPSPFPPDVDLFPEISRENPTARDGAIEIAIQKAQRLLEQLYRQGRISGMISAGGGTGTHLGTSIMRVLPLGVPKVMVSTVASRNMANTVGTKDITMMHSVVDLLGVNSISGRILENAAGAICGMVQRQWKPEKEKKRIALSFFGFITPAAEGIKRRLDEMGYEVIAFHANGTGGMAMEELAREGYFHGILDLAIHELADALMDGYCGGIGPERLELPSDGGVPRLVVPGGMDCAVLEFTRNSVPERFKDRKIFFYDFRSAIRLNLEESRFLSGQLAEKLNRDPARVKMLVPSEGWSEPDRTGGPLYDPEMNEAFLFNLKANLDPRIQVKEVKYHINDPGFAEAASLLMDEMLRGG